MPAIEIACPNCGRKLKLPDSSLLGRKGRCSKCRHGFIMQAPASPQADVTAIHFAEAPSPSAAGNMQFESEGADENIDADSDKTLMGISVRFVPEAPAARAPAQAATLSAAASPALPPLPSASDIASLSEVLVESSSDSDEDNLLRVRQMRKKSKRQRMIFGGVAAALALALGLGAYSFSKPSNKIAKKGGSRATKAQAAEDEDSVAGAGHPGDGAGADEKPGEQITLNLVPNGARIIIHLRPAELWQAGSAGEEFRACLGPLGVWMEKTIQEQCLLAPSEIEEATFALIPASREAFDVAVCVRSRADLKRSDLITKFGGELVDTPKPHYKGDERAWIIGNGNRTFAGTPNPKENAESLAESVDTPSTTADGVQALLSMTDRKRHFTLVCDLDSVRLGSKTLVPDNAQKFLEAIVDFFGDDVDSVCWSVQLGDAEGGNNFKSQVLVRNKLSRKPANLQADLKKKLAKVPSEVFEIAQLTHPKKLGEKKIVGRYPIMTKMVQELTRFDTGHRLVSMKVELPERAGPNLALGTLLTWNQTTLPGFGSAPAAPAVAAAKSNLPDKVADRLKKKITVDFRREFMYKAMEFISDEIGVTIKLDGPGMKEVGITQNEYQTFALEDAPATVVLQKILGPKNLILVVDEQAKTATVTSIPMAERKKLTPFPLEPASK
ncbi:MAG: hypothetical protein HY290_00755 [Planctomycetia bacterium]|nr:hypothetical protein [Planctomycetia bacterium]